MTTPLADIYNEAFFADYGRQAPAYCRVARTIAREIHRRFEPKTVTDWGCGAGVHIAEFAACGCDIRAVDGVRAPNAARMPGLDVHVHDLSRQVSDARLFETYDLSLCIDVLEHLPDNQSAQVLANITRGARLLILSCAPPGQGGHHHVNERPRRYWVERLRAIGWQYDRKATGAMERYFLADQTLRPHSWMYHNLCVYRPSP